MPPTTCDIAIVGAGAVGCAIARRLALAGHRVVLIEKGADILAGASKGNSAILHTGFDAPTDSLELSCMQAGHAEYLAIADRFNLPVLKSGAMVVAWTEAEADRLPHLEALARANGVNDVARLTPPEIAAREPHLAPALGALLVPREYLIDPWTPFLAYVESALSNGAVFLRQTEVTGGEFDGSGWSLNTTAGPVRATTVINAAGLYGDRVEAALLGDAHFTILPRRGQFVVYDKAATALIDTIILPVPNERTKGVVLTRTVFGNVLIGPTAEETDQRDSASVDGDSLRSLVAAAERMVPALAGMPINATYAGLRPATDDKAYRIRHEPARNWLTVGGIRSTGLTASLGLAQHVERLLDGQIRDTAAECGRRMPMLAEHGVRAWQGAGSGPVVCHCEMVTDAEIEAALTRACPAGDLAGLKRRTRCTMGRCQGFNCLGRIAEMTRGRLAVPVVAGTSP